MPKWHLFRNYLLENVDLLFEGKPIHVYCTAIWGKIAKCCNAILSFWCQPVSHMFFQGQLTCVVLTCPNLVYLYDIGLQLATVCKWFVCRKSLPKTKGAFTVQPPGFFSIAFCCKENTGKPSPATQTQNKQRNSWGKVSPKTKSIDFWTIIKYLNIWIRVYIYIWTLDALSLKHVEATTSSHSRRFFLANTLGLDLARSLQVIEHLGMNTMTRCVSFTLWLLYIYNYISIIEGSLNSKKLPTIWRVEKQMRWSNVQRMQMQLRESQKKETETFQFNLWIWILQLHTLACLLFLNLQRERTSFPRRGCCIPPYQHDNFLFECMILIHSKYLHLIWCYFRRVSQTILSNLRKHPSAQAPQVLSILDLQSLRALQIEAICATLGRS